MSIEFSQSTVDFGKLSQGAQRTIDVELDFGSPLTSQAQLAIADSAFSVSPATAPVGTKDLTVTVSVTTPNDPGNSTTSSLEVTGGATGSVSVSVTCDDPPSPTETTTDKHALLAVPDYGDTTVINPPATSIGHDGGELVSFLRLGKFDWDSETPAAKELLKLIPQVTSATNPSHYDANGDLNASEGTPSDLGDLGSGIVFADDIRDRPQDWDNAVSSGTESISSADDPAHGLTKAERLAESALLYKRGGWRDHSDRNRLSTTYGDKVEVIRGNYKMIVMGRQDDTGEAMGWDVGGSHIQDYAPGTMPGASFWLEWINDARFHRPNYNQQTNAEEPGLAQKGVWLLVNTTENVYEYARNAGNFREEIWGDVNETYIGSSNPPTGTAYATDATHGTGGHSPPHRLHDRNYDYPGGSDSSRSSPPWNLDNVGTIRSNPHIIEKTWAERIDSHTGCGDCPVPHISEETFADKIVERTEIGKGKNITELRHDAMTTVHGGVIDNTRVLGMNIGLMSVAGMSLDVTTVAGAHLEMSNSLGIKAEWTNVGIVHLEAYLALAGHVSLDASLFKAEFDFAIAKLECTAGKEFELTGAGISTVVPAEDTIAATKTEIMGKVQELAADVVMVNASMKSATGTESYISSSTMMMANTVFMM